MHDLITRAYAALASIHPLAPWLVLLELIFLPQYLVRKYRPTWWEWAATFGWRVAPETTIVALALKVWQGLPSVLAGALFTAYVSNGDPRAAFYGALLGAAAPLRHELMKRIPNSVLPYVGGSYPAASTAPRTPPPPVLPLTLITFLVAIGLALAPSACGGAPEVVRAPSSAACDASSCDRSDAGDAGDAGAPTGVRVVGSVPAELEREADMAGVQHGAVVVTLKIAEGVERAIICGGQIELVEELPDAGRSLLNLKRGGQ